MIYRHLGKTGIKTSVFGYGNWLTGKIEDDVVFNILNYGFQKGMNFVDTAEVYGNGVSELSLGRAIKKGVTEGVWKRSDWVISTKLFKIGPGVNDVGLSRKHLIEGLKASLQRLQLDYVDIVFAHRYDSETTMEEIVGGFSFLVNHGYTFYWGTSEWPAYRILEAHATARQYNLVPPIVEQPEYNMISREKVEKEFLPLYKTDTGLGLTTWSPLKYGILTGKYNDGIPDGSRFANNSDFFKDTIARLQTPEGQQQIAKVKEVSAIAKEIGCTMTQLALAWVIANENVSVCLLGGTNLDQIKENFDTLNFLSKLTPEIKDRIEAILKTKPEIPVSAFGR